MSQSKSFKTKKTERKKSRKIQNGCLSQKVALGDYETTLPILPGAVVVWTGFSGSLLQPIKLPEHFPNNKDNSHITDYDRMISSRFEQ